MQKNIMMFWRLHLHMYVYFLTTAIQGKHQYDFWQRITTFIGETSPNFCISDTLIAKIRESRLWISHRGLDLHFRPTQIMTNSDRRTETKRDSFSRDSDRQELAFSFGARARVIKPRANLDVMYSIHTQLSSSLGHWRGISYYTSVPLTGQGHISSK